MTMKQAISGPRPRRRTRLLSLLGLLPALAIAGGAGAAEIQIGNPAVGDHRVDICLEWGMQCNGEAANVWCTSQGYDRAVAWEIDPDIGASHPTLVLGASQVCDQPHCDGYLSITCAIEDAWTNSTGHGGVVVKLERESGDSPEGILLIAVSEQDVRQATAAVVGMHGVALLHAPPGKWRLYAVNYSNPEQIRALPGYIVEVPAGKDGTYVTVLTD
jgi:hypothetical protein